jgi:hypothetical protein
VIEALVKLTALEALTELPRGPQPNAPRIFASRAHPYWGLVDTYLAEIEPRFPEGRDEAS